MKLRIIIMIMILTIIMGVYFVTIPVFGKEISSLDSLIIIKGTTEESQLEVEGYVILENSVNLEEVGNYQILYQNIETEELITREVKVLAQDTSLYFDIEESEINGNPDYEKELQASASFDDHQQVLIVKYTPLNDSQKYANLFMYIIEKNTIIREVLLYYNVMVDVYDIAIDGESFVLTGRFWDFNQKNYDVFLCSYQKNGLMKENIRLQGSGDDVGYKIGVTKNTYIITGKTNSLDKDFQNNKKVDSYFIASLDRITCDVIQLGTEQNEINFKDCTLLCNDQETFLLYKTADKNLTLVKINNEGTYLKTKILLFEDSIEYLKAFLRNNLIYILVKSEKEKGDYYQLFTTNIKEELKLIYEEEAYDRILTSTWDKTLTLLYNSDQGLYLKSLDDKYQIIYQYLLEKDLLVNQEINLLQGGFCGKSNNQRIIYYDYHYLIIKNLGNTKISGLDDDYHDYQLIYNGEVLKHDPNKTIDLVDCSLFGDYELTYYFDSDLDIIINKKIEVLPLTGVEDNQTYDLGVRLVFNGVAFLNNESVESGYIITKPGHYSLELRGKAGKNIVQNFNVTQLSISPDLSDVLNPHITFNISNDNDIINSFQNDIIVNSVNQNPKTNNSLTWMYAIPLISIISVVFMIIKIKY